MPKWHIYIENICQYFYSIIAWNTDGTFIRETERIQEYKVLYKHFSMFPSPFVFFPLYNVSSLPTIPFLLCYIQSWKWAWLKGLEHLMQEYKRLDYHITLDIFHTYQNKKTNPSQNLLSKIAKKLASEYIKIPS